MRNIEIVALIGRLKSGEAGIWGAVVAFWFPGSPKGFGYAVLRDGILTEGLGASGLYEILLQESAS